jgi:hypothetical protein
MPGIAGGGYIAKKLVDLAGEIAKQHLITKRKKGKVTLYGPNGDALKTIDVDPPKGG